MERYISKKITSEELSILDNNSEWLGIDKSLLMECAGYSLTTEIINKYQLTKNTKVVIFAGTGNNGGDAFVVARHLASQRIPVFVLLLGNPDKIRTRESKSNWDVLLNLEHSIERKIIKDSKDLVKIKDYIENDMEYRVIIDGLLGTGIQGKIREPISSCITMINRLKKDDNRFNVVSIDVPSGMDPNNGKVSDMGVKADLVVTFHEKKAGFKSSNDYIKEVIVKPIGIPLEASILVGRGDLLQTLKKRQKNNHKGQFGKILIIGGSKSYTGAPAYSSLAAIHFGCDLVITYVPDLISIVLKSYSPDLIVRSTPGDWLNMDSFDEIKNLINWADSILIGPGLGNESQTKKLVINLVKTLVEKKKKFVLDADALKFIKDSLEIIKGSQCILTPHEEELKIMTGVSLPPHDEVEKREKILLALAKKLDVTLILKGPYDYIASKSKIKINKTGCPEMSIGGTGDVLAGFCACFLGTGNSVFQSACSAAFLNGYLGEHCKSIIGPRFTAMNMIDAINEVILEFQQK
ncbi:MAG: NAD(P)H-hydrate dehydratase [Promethearchaeota archaeon]